MTNLTVAPQNIPTTSRMQSETARALAREQRLYANAMNAVRNRDEIYEEIAFYCDSIESAHDAFYSYNRGNEIIEGANIKLLRAIACAFGFVRSGWRVLETHDTYCEVLAFAEDMKKGSVSEIEFTVRFWRETQKGGYALTGDRDKYEITSNMASRRVRKCLEDIIPSALVRKAEAMCMKTLRSQGSLEERIVTMINKYAEMGIEKARLASYLQHPVESATEYEVVRLGKVFRAIADGVTTAKDQFPSEAEQKLKGLASKPTDPQASPIEEASFRGVAQGAQSSGNESDSPAEENVSASRSANVAKATRADINSLIRIAIASSWKDEEAVKAELRDLGISKPSDLEKTRLEEISRHLSHGPRGSWTHMYWMGSRCELNNDGLLKLIRDVTGAEVAHGHPLEQVEIDAVYVELDNRILEHQQAALTLGVSEEGDTKGD